MDKSLLEDAVTSKNILDVVNKSISVANQSLDLVKKDKEKQIMKIPVQKDTFKPTQKQSKPNKPKQTKTVIKQVIVATPVMAAPKVTTPKPKVSVQKPQPNKDDTALKNKIQELTEKVSMARNSEELLKKEIALLKDHLKEFKSEFRAVKVVAPSPPPQPQQPPIDTAALIESMNKLTGVVRQMMTLFVQANRQIQQADDPITRSLKKLEDQNEKIAQGILAVADMVKETATQEDVAEPVVQPQSYTPQPQPVTYQQPYQQPSPIPDLPSFPGMPPRSAAQGKVQFRSPREEIRIFEDGRPLITPNIAPPPPEQRE